MAFDEDLTIVAIALVGALLGAFMGSLGSYLFQYKFEQRRERFKIKETIGTLISENIDLASKQMYYHFLEESIDVTNEISYERTSKGAKIKSLIILYLKKKDDINKFSSKYVEIGEILNKYRKKQENKITDELYLEENHKLEKIGIRLLNILKDSKISL